MDNRIRLEKETDEERRRQKGGESQRTGRREETKKELSGKWKKHMGHNPIHETDELELGGT